MTEEDVLPAIAAEHDMVHSAWKMDAGFTCHGKKLHLIYPRVKPDTVYMSRTEKHPTAFHKDPTGEYSMILTR